MEININKCKSGTITEGNRNAKSKIWTTTVYKYLGAIHPNYGKIELATTTKHKRQI